MSKMTEQNIVTTAIDENIDLDGALLPILHHIQKSLGFIPDENVSDIATALNLSRAEVHGVISFYHSFTNSPDGKHVIEICRAESCQAMGGRELEAAIKAQLGIDYEQTTSDGEFTLKPVYCFGNCACSPSIKIDSQLHGRLTSEQATTKIEKLRTGDS